jgi:hypothetical protein
MVRLPAKQIIWHESGDQLQKVGRGLNCGQKFEETMSIVSAMKTG